MAEFTVQEAMDLIRRIGPGHYLVFRATSWGLSSDRTGRLVEGKTPDELRKALETRTMPTAEEAAKALGPRPRDACPANVVTLTCEDYETLRRFIEAHKEQPNG